MRTVQFVAFVLIACGAASHPSFDLDLPGTSIVTGDGVARRVAMKVGETRTIELVLVGATPGPVTFSASNLPRFATLDGPVVTLAPRRGDGGEHTLTLTANAGGESRSVRLTVAVTEPCLAQACRDVSSSRWSQAIGTAGDDYVEFIAADGQGNAYAAGRIGGQDLFLRKYGPTGAMLLEKVWTSSMESPPDVYGLATVPSGGVVLSVWSWCRPGATCSGPDFGLGPTAGTLLMALDPAGNAVWQRDSGFGDAQGVTTRPRYDRPAVDSAGNLVVFAEDSSGTFVAKLDPRGNEVWRRPKGNLRFASGQDIVVDQSGNVVFVSQQMYGPSMVVKLDAPGNTVWSVNTPAGKRPGSVAVGRDGTVVVALEDHLAYYSGSDGSLRAYVTMPYLTNGNLVVAAGDRVAVAGMQFDRSCSTTYVENFDFQGNALFALPLPSPNGCNNAPTAFALSMTADGQTVVGGYFDVPYDFGAGAFHPRGRDGFVVAIGP